MNWVSWRALASAILFLCALPFEAQTSQETTLSARINIAGHAAKNGRSDNAVVWLTPINPPVAPRPFPADQPRLTQHHKSFEPHILVVPVGAVVEFPNRDPFFHNVFSLFEGKRFDLGLYEAGTSRKVTFDRPGISYIFCNIHAEMSAVVIALDTPYYGISDRRGDLVISQVPPGRYTMHVWYETALPTTLSALTHEINVTPDTTTLGVVQVPGSVPLSAHKNKYGMDYEPPAPESPGYDRPENSPPSR